MKNKFIKNLRYSEIFKAKKAFNRLYMRYNSVLHRLVFKFTDRIKFSSYVPDYCIKGITRGYLKSSPLEALMLAIIIQITFKVIRNPIIGNPITIKHNGAARTI
jgi:hypothetical protein